MFLLQLSVYGDDGHRVCAEIEEIAVAADLLDAEHVGEGDGDHPFRLIRCRHIDFLWIRHTIGCREAGTIELAIDGEGEGIEEDEVGGNHVRR